VLFLLIDGGVECEMSVIFIEVIWNMDTFTFFFKLGIGRGPNPPFVSRTQLKLEQSFVWTEPIQELLTLGIRN